MPQYKQRSQAPILLIILGAFLLIGTMILLVFQNASATPTAIPPSHEEDTYPEIPRVTLSEAKAAFDSGSAIFIDVRSTQAYQDSHIAGSVNIPLAELELRISELDPADWIITYCT